MELHLNFNSTLTFRVVFESRENYRVMDEKQNLFAAELAGKMRRRGDGLWPVVGDWVTGTPQPGDWLLIENVLPRHGVLQRQDPQRGSVQILAANVDTLFIVTSANQDFNLNRLDRYVALGVAGGVRPVILINKMELANDPYAILDSAAPRFPGTDIIGVSAKEGWNLNSLEEYAQPGQTVAFIGVAALGLLLMILFFPTVVFFSAVGLIEKYWSAKG
jgi:ribosome biogenesis GTPase